MQLLLPLWCGKVVGMSVAGASLGSLRQERAELSRLAWAFAISMVVHLLIFGGYETGKKLHWWENAHWPAWLSPVKKLADALKKKDSLQPAQPLQPHETPLLFVDVDPANAAPEAPKNATHYSSLNSQAANPDIDKESNLPKITGEQKHVPKTEDVARNKPVPLQPAPPLAPPAKEAQEEERPKAAQPPGDLAMAKPDHNPPKDQGEAPHERPRTIREALARQQNNQLVGQKMKQEGGVQRRLDTSLFDTAATPYGAYDRYLIDAISQRWYSLLDERSYSLDNRGKVVLQFVLHPDGRITDMTVSENSAGDVLGYICEKAVLDPAPFPAWPKEMRRMIGENRPIQFTFYYEY
jgi:outer membrane biosynthesis protein TonB